MTSLDDYDYDYDMMKSSNERRSIAEKRSASVV
jgi:hypothetical protein